MSIEPVRVWQFASVWGLPSGSPFCMKLECWLRLASIPYEVHVIEGPVRSPTGKAPYVERADGTLLCDSSHIIETLGRERDVQLDALLDAERKAKLTAIQRLLEEHLYWLLVHDRWVEEEGWRQFRPAVFGAMGRPFRWFVPELLRRGVRRSVHAQGLGRLGLSERRVRARSDLSALSTFLGEQEYFLGEATTVDAMAIALLANIYLTPIQGVVAQEAVAFPNLRRYAEERYAALFPERQVAAAGG